MCTLGIGLVPNPEGMTVVRKRYDPSLLAFSSEPDLLYVFQWWLPHDSASSLMRETSDLVSPHADRMSASNLHCTSFVSHELEDEYAICFSAI